MKDTNPKINCLLQIMSMSRLGLMYRLVPRAPAVTSILRPGLVFDIPPCSRGAKAAAKGGAKGGGKKGAAMVKPVLEVETDAHKVSCSAELRP